MRHGLFGIGILVTAYTSCGFLISSSSNLLVKVETLSFMSMSSRRKYMMRATYPFLFRDEGTWFCHLILNDEFTCMV